MHFILFLFSLSLLAVGFSFDDVHLLSLYVDNKIPSSATQNGSKENPYSSLLQALEYIHTKPDFERNVKVLLAYSEEFYTLEYSNFTLKSNDCSTIEIATWIKSPNDAHATINFTNSTLEVEELELFKFSNLNIDPCEGHINLISSNLEMESTDLMTSITLGETFISMIDGDIVIFDAQIIVPMYNTLLEYTNPGEKHPKISLNNITFFLMDPLGWLFPTSMIFIFKGNKKTLQGEISVRKLDIIFPTNKGPSVEKLFEIKNFKDVYFGEFELVDKEFHGVLGSDLLLFENIETLNFSVTIENCSFQFAYFAHFFSFKQIKTLNFNHLKLIGNDFIDRNIENLYFMAFEKIQNLNLHNQIIEKNTFDVTSFEIFYFSKYLASIQDKEVCINVSGLTINNNTNIRDNANFGYLSMEAVVLADVQVTNIEYSWNNLSGRLFFFKTQSTSQKNENSEIFHFARTQNFSQIKIHNNKLLNFNFYYFNPTAKYLDSDDCLQIIENNVLFVENLLVANNSFLKEVSDDWPLEPSFFQLKQTRVHFDNLTFANNSLNSYNFLSLDTKPSSMILTSSKFTNNTLRNSKLITTNYLRGFECLISGNYHANHRFPLYRYGFILDSKFSLINLISSTLFSLDNGFIALNNTSFTLLTLSKQSTLISTKYSPVPLFLGDSSYHRDAQGEYATLRNHTLAYKVFNETLEKAAESHVDPVYFYSITNSVFGSISCQNSKIISLNDFSMNQSFIQFENNTFAFLRTEEKSTDPFIEIQAFHSVNFKKNKFTSINGTNFILSLYQDNQPCSLTVDSNNFVRLNVSGLINFNGKNINDVNIINNSIKDSVCGPGCISVTSELASGDWIFDNNLIKILILEMRSVSISENPGFITFASQKTETHYELKFINNDFDTIFMNFVSREVDLMAFKVEHAILYQSNKIVSFFNDSPGNLLSIQTLDSFSIKDSFFKEIMQYRSKKGTISFSALDTDISNSTFIEIRNTAGPGLFGLHYRIMSPSLEIFNCSFNTIYSLTSGSVITTKSAALENIPYWLSFKMYDVNMEKLFDTTIFHFEDIFCIACVLRDSYFGITKESKLSPTSNFNFEKFSGGFEIDNVEFALRLDKEQPLIQLRNSSGLITINNLDYDGQKGSFYFAQLDSGTFIVKNSKIHNVMVSISPIINIVPINNKLIKETKVKVEISDTIFNDIFLNSTSSFGSEGLVELLKNKNSLNFKPKQFALLFSVLPTELSVHKSTFESIDGVPAFMFGAVEETFMHSNFIMISESTFRNFHSFVGSAITVLPVSYSPVVKIQGSSFENNKAYAGSCLFIYNSSLIISNSSFKYNSARFIGAAIFVGGSTAERQNQDIANDVVFINNTGKYPGDIRSEAVDYKIFYRNKEFSGIKTLPSSDESIGMHLTNVSNLELQHGIITIRFIDNEGNFTPDFSLVQLGVLDFPNNKEAKFQSVFTAYIDPCDDLSCNISLNNIQIIGNAYETIEFKLNFTSDRVIRTKKIIADLRSCLPGEYNNSQVCQPCLSPTFSTDPSKTCETCPSNAHCPGQAKVCPLPGFWSINSSSTKIIPCRNDTRMRCNNEDCHGCATGYSGPLCEACDFKNDYVEIGYLSCGKCKDPSRSLLYSILASIGFTLYQLFSVFSLYSANKATLANQSSFLEKRRIERSFYIKLLLTYTQLMSIIYVSASNMFKSLGLLNQVGDPASLIVYGTQCSMIAVGINYENFMYYQSYFVMVSPIAQLIAIFFCLLLMSCFMKIAMKKMMTVAVLYLIMSHQPGIVGNLAQFLSCKDVDGVGYKYVTSHAHWSCQEDRYQTAANFIVMPSALIWCAIIPILILSSMILKRNHLKSEEVTTSYGVLITDFEDKFYYWGIIVMILKLVLAFLMYGLNSKDEVQIFMSLILLWGYQSLVRALKPYRFGSFNTFEIAMMNLLMFNIIVAKYLIDPANGSTLSMIFVIMSLVLNGGFLVVVLWKVLSLTFIQILAKIEQLILKRNVSHNKDYQLIDEPRL